MSIGEAEAQELTCPKCKGVMERILYRQTVVDRCKGCSGIWFDISEHEDLKGTEGSEKIDTGDRATGKKMDSMRDIDCPSCGNRMVSLLALKRREIRYEKCSICYGVFLDAGEFEDYKQEMSFADILTSALFGFRPD